MSIRLRIMNETGHTELMMASSEIIEQIDTHRHIGLSLMAILYQEDIRGINWEEVSSVDLIQAIVGGQE